MVSTEITVGDREIIDSGVVTAFNDEKINIKLSPDSQTGSNNEESDSGDLEFIFTLTEDSDEDPSIKVNPINDNVAEYELVNMRNTEMERGGVTPRKGLIKPIEVGDMGGRKILMNFQVSGRSSQEVDLRAIDFYYSIYLGGEVDE